MKVLAGFHIIGRKEQAAIDASGHRVGFILS
jgi:hypothetical protein